MEAVSHPVHRHIEIAPDWSDFGPTFKRDDERRIEVLERQGTRDPSIVDGEVVQVTVGDDEISIPREKMKVTIEELDDSVALARPTVGLVGHYVLEAKVILENLHILDGMWTLYLRPESESS